ncbi:signal recognition particle subunit SRP72 [Condylostylus longicornis]|uniref:signal recognition particle subunit SRP72 n=1 Tax=Condylostylus longicornis TaxID=2530218 RepID=UPI00244DE806|nr:signal recognition particle subunit SRP72 [Condylostylus longicornis]
MSKDQNKDAAIKAAFADINKFGLNGEYEKAMKSVNRVLGLAPTDEKALHCKVVCLIQVQKFTEAIQFIEKNKLRHLVFENAYCEYRLNQPEKAIKIIEQCGIEPLPQNLKELLCQILYRLERYEECFNLYKDIIKHSEDDFEDERKANLSAVVANLAIDPQKELPNLPENTYEMCFNSSCALSNRGKYQEAEKKLRQSEKLCKETLEDDGATEEEIQDELSVIKVQLAYCLQMQGKTKEAASLYAECLKKKSSDPALIAVASNNSVVINKDQNVFDSKKKIRLAMADACESKLTKRQKRSIAINNCLFNLFASSNDQCQQLCNKLAQTYPDAEFEILLIKVSLLIKEKKYKEALDILEKFVKADNENSFAIKFAIVQVLLMNGNKKAAIEKLQSLENDKYKPGIVSALVTLYLGLDNKKAASDILKSAVEWYKKHKVSGGNLSDMWRQAAEFHLRGGAAETAASSLEELLKSNPNDMKVLAQLVIAYAQFDPKKAQQVSKKLPALEALTTASEIDILEATNWMMSTKAVKKTATIKTGDQSPGTPGTDIQKKRRLKRKRKGKLPKNYNPNVPPDPERWLPKYERTGYRKKRDRRNKDVIKGSQGMASGAADQYDMSKAQNLSKSSPATPAYQESNPGPRQHHRKGGQKKKKGRH